MQSRDGQLEITRVTQLKAVKLVWTPVCMKEGGEKKIRAEEVDLCY